VLHEGRVVHTYSVGFRNRKRDLPANENTLYMLASVSKNYLVAAVGILVHEGKLKWTDTIRKHVPDFDPKGDPRIGEQADFISILRHSSGLTNPVTSWLGPYGSVLLPPQDVVKLANTTPVGNSEGLYFNRTWEYSNVGYGVVVKAVENASGLPYSRFIEEKILNPLGLRRTFVTKQAVEEDDNVALPYAKLSDGSWVELTHEWTSEKNSPVLGAFGKRSCVNDLLKWCAATMAAESGDAGDMKYGILQDIEANPLKRMKFIRSGHWSRPHKDKFQNRSEYCLGWFLAVMPTSQVTWGSYNSMTSELETTHHHYILGEDSPKKLMIKHTGLGIGTAVSVHTFPETRSAVVALSNGLNVGDAADFAAQVLIQELFNLKPRKDLSPWMELEINKREKEFDDIIMSLWWENRDVSAPERPRDEFVGNFEGLAIVLTVRKNVRRGTLELMFNQRDDVVVPLEYYNRDQYSYMPTTRDEWLAGGWLDWDYYMVGILDFYRNEYGDVDGLYWQWEQYTPPYLFKKVNLEAVSQKIEGS
jgi:CubicO group peptidase (beta-lactamase class C family)